MKRALGLILIVVGIFVGLYVGFWICFIGGIVQVITAFKATNIDAMIVALGVARIIFASILGWITGMVIILPGYVMLVHNHQQARYRTISKQARDRFFKK